jgi:putative hydrolase of the HAD superfamily
VIEPFAPGHTLLIDDNLCVLCSAREYGIAHLCAICQPDTRGPRREVVEFPVIESFKDILPAVDRVTPGTQPGSSPEKRSAGT